ncbi:DUF6701 domain-containing protein [Cellvibrio japonicus]|uniref:MSHA biogenesis protein MshQ n=1 Tax=Cellvibrio japonicus (strain Ueda107) TaxID=498211 RepID=B3PKB7_CELJU|nr:DUF6701 domain-containing protein [Cellvibrio japonicus]ACE86143.1 MSHA biogenesis protein MshQ [Cellvibrio japonicus Ueda107]QEI12790.1 hypothetical protein FY117_11515 [Cellvibrio japonicus]QEI16364.1 hypothetical protein FY116_11520 [Cellvibrio japonicus]QEI19942.1 hypothetical protein FY115_11515 [Cellvibrio japonicus]
MHSYSLKPRGNLLRRIVSGLLLFIAVGVNAATYNLTSGQYPPCDTSWSVSGTTYTCTGHGRVTLANGDVLTANTNITISANNGFSLTGSTIGTAAANINLVSSYGTVVSAGTNTINGSITAASGEVTLVNTAVTGAITTGGNINLTGGSVGGLVTSNNNTITTNGTTLAGGARAQSGMSLTGGTLSGNFVMTSANPITLSGVTMTGGSISGASTVTIQNGSVLGSASSAIAISSNSGDITVNNSTVYGDLTAPSYATVRVTNGGAVYGTCLPNSTPANACNAAPPVCTTGLIGGLTGAYFNNVNLSGTAAGTRVDTRVDFNWGSGSPGVSGIGSDQFSARWNGRVRAPVTGNYRFQTVSDDGVRLWVNNQLLIDNWNDHSATTNTSGTITLEAGYAYDLRLEYYENGGQAVIRLLWSMPGADMFNVLGTAADPNPSTANYCEVPAQDCSSGFVGSATGQFFNNTSLSGTPVATRQDTIIDFDWGTGPPGPAGIGNDTFSVRWDANLRVGTTGSYQFQTLSDDGVRLWVNNQLLINNWSDHAVTTDTSVPINLTAGTVYPLRLEFYEQGVHAVISLRWQRPGDSTFSPIVGCPAAVSYYGIFHSGSGITCAAEPVTIRAYDAAGNLVAPNAGTQVLLSTAPATGSWVSPTYIFSGAETSFTAYLRQTTAATLNINLTDGVVSESVALDPPITFANAGLKFYANASGFLPIPNQRAGITDSAPVLRAMRTNENTGACEARVTGTRTVNLAYECVDPSTCIAGQVFTAAGAAITGNSALGIINYAPVSLTFNAAGVASVPINYSDVGMVRLHAALPLAASGNDPAITLSGSSDAFVVRPERLAVTLVEGLDGKANPGATSAPGAAAGFVAAGAPFRVVVQAQNANQQPTPNFGREASTENNIVLKEFTLDYPGGGALTILANAIAGSFTSTAPAGSFQNANISWEQVGSLTVRPELADNNYMGAGAPDYIASNTIGRFYPDRFSMVASFLANSCGSFSYMSHGAIPLNYELQALSASGAVLSNYGPAYSAGPALNYVAENADMGDGALLSSRIVEGSPKNWSAGILQVNTNATFNRAAAPDGPYTDLRWGLGLTDSFDMRELAGKNMNADSAAACVGTSCNAVQLGSVPLNLRFGRLRLDDAFGPESVDLPVNFVTEYWTGNLFSINSADNCTLISRGAINYPSGILLNPAHLVVPLAGGSTTGIYGHSAANPLNIVFQGGNAAHYFQAPGSGTGDFDVDINLTSYPWLRYDWNQDGDYSDASLPTARFGFGQYRGHDRIIYWRERFD